MTTTLTTDLTATVTYLYAAPSPLVHQPSRPKGWRTFDYDGTRPCLPVVVMRELSHRLARRHS